MNNFVARHSIVRQIWGNPDLILLVFAGSAAEFALNRAVDWLFFTGKIPNDPINRLFSTVAYAQKIVFADEQTAEATISRINAIHSGVERERGQTIPDWAYRDVLYMLVDYSERAYQLLYHPLTETERTELYSVFLRFGEIMKIPELPATYAEWQQDRALHLERDLVYSDHTRRLFAQYRHHLGEWRYHLLLEVQASLVPEKVRSLLRFSSNNLLSSFVWTYSIVEQLSLQSLVRAALIPPEHFAAVQKLDRRQTV